jgi:hypothetical protein
VEQVSLFELLKIAKKQKYFYRHEAENKKQKNEQEGG